MERNSERYELLRILGEGGTGQVYLARDTHLGRLVAVKALNQETERFQKEVRILQEQAFFMLPVIYDAWTEKDNTGRIVMEYVKGRNLKEYLALCGELPEKQIYEWGLQLGTFLQKLHTKSPKVIYRDLKPENIMVQPDKRLRLIDVGAAVCTSREKTGERIRIGTLGYASPEQWEGRGVDERTDIYALGAVLIDMLNSSAESGKHTSSAAWHKAAGHFGRRRQKKPGAVPEGMILIARRCMEREREKRYATAEAFLKDWKRYKRLGSRRFLISAMLRAGCCFSLLEAAFVLWFGEAVLFKAAAWLFAYVCLKISESAFDGKRAYWEQKKSVWCHGG